MALIPEDPKKRNALVVGLVVVAGLYFFNDLWWSGKKEEISTLETRLEALESANRRAQIQSTRGAADLEERLALYERHVIQLERLIPRREEVASLLASIQREAERAGVEVTEFRPEGEEPGSFYVRRSYQLEVMGDYHNVGSYLTAIASLDRIVATRDLELNRFQGAEVVTRDMEAPVQAVFRIETYVLPDSPPGGGAPDQAGGDE